MDTGDLIKFIFSTSAVVAGIIFIARTIFIKFFDFARDRYKSKLNQDLEQFRSNLSLEVEKYKAQLNLANAEQGIRFSKLHEKRAGIIEEMYELLMDLQKTLKWMTTIYQKSGWFSDSTRHTEANNSLKKFFDFYNKSRIYLPISTCLLIQELRTKSLDVMFDFFRIQVQAYRSFEESRDSFGDKEVLDKWKKIDETVDSQIQQVRNSLENSFRVMLGDPVTENVDQLKGQLDWNEFT
jgi:hypothetical protein